MKTEYTVEPSPDSPKHAVLIKVVSGMSGKEHSMLFGISLTKFMECKAKLECGVSIEEAFPMLNRSELFFLTTGITPVEFELMARNGREW